MKSKTCFLVLASLVLLPLFSCTKEENPPISQKEISDCHHRISWDAIRTRDALIGEWKWEYVSCFWTPDKDNDDDFKGLTVEFRADQTLSVKKNGVLIQTSSWQVVSRDVNHFAIEAEPFVQQLYGRILFVTTGSNLTTVILTDATIILERKNSFNGIFLGIEKLINLTEDYYSRNLFKKTQIRMYE